MASTNQSLPNVEVLNIKKLMCTLATITHFSLKVSVSYSSMSKPTKFKISTPLSKQGFKRIARHVSK